MYQSSVAFGNLIQQDSRTFQAKITLGDKSITDGIKSIKVSGGSNSEDDFSLGSAVSQYVEITLASSDAIFEGHEFLLEMGVMVNDSVEEYIPMGYFTAEKPDSDEDQITFTAYDRMMKMERACFLDLPDQTNTVAVLKAISTIAGVPIITEGLTAISMQKPVGYTCREVLSYIGQMYGGFAICNRSGQIEIKTYEDHNYKVPTGRYWDTFTHNDLPFVLQKMTCYTGQDEDGEDISVSVGTGVRNVSFSNPFITQAALNDIWKKLQNYTYMPGNVRFLGDPRIDPWDILTVEDRNGKSYKVPAMKLTQDFDGGLSTEVEAVGKSEAEQDNGFQGPNTRQMERYYAQLVLIDHAMVNKLDADTAKITYATIDNLDAVKASIEDLDVTSLTARVATIEEAYIDRAQVNTLLADYATVGNLNATNAQITTLSGELVSYKTVVAGQLTAFDADITNLKAKDAEIEKAVIGKASITDLEAVRTRTQSLEADVADINTLVNGNLTSANIHSLTLNSKNTTIENGMIKNAMIESLAFDKITGLDINTTKLTVHSEDGRSVWTDNTIQISDAKRVRVQIGEDAAGDYNLYLWDAAGNLLWNATGVTESGLNDGIIKDVAVADNANIAGSKLNIPSVVKEINGCQTRISSSVINIDQAGQTLSAYLNVMETTIGDNLDAAKLYADGQLSSAQNYALNQANAALANAKSYADSAVNGLEIGARNLVSDSREISVTRNDTTYSWLKEKSPFIKNTEYGFAQIQAGGKFTISFDYEITGITTACSMTVNLKYTSSNYSNIGKSIKLSVGDNTGHYEYTFTPTAEQMQYGTQWILSGFGAGNNQGIVITLRRIMLEKGTKATDWKPAPEDTDAQITNLTEITTTHATNISVMQGQISSLIAEDTTIKGDYNALVSRYNATVATVDSMKTTIGEHTTLLDSQGKDILATSNRLTTVETGLDGIKTRVSAAETSLKKKADGTTVDSLTSRVAAAEVTLDGFGASLTATNKTVSDNFTALNDKFESIEIGGRNLLRNTGTYKGWVYNKTKTSITDDTVTISNSGSTSNTYYGVSQWIGDGTLTALDGKSVTISFDIRSDDWDAVNEGEGTNARLGGVAVQIINTESVPFGTKYNQRKYLFIRLTNSQYVKSASAVNGKWTRVVLKPLKISRELFVSGTSSGGNDDYVLFQIHLRRNGTISIRHIMVEEGTTAGSWTPAPEDIRAELEETNTTVATHAEQISSHEARITATEKSIELKVSSTEFTSYQTTVTNAINTAKSSAISTAASDATAKANNAKNSAISAASADATTKANNALADAKSYADAGIAGIEIGGRNLIKRSAYAYKTNRGITITYGEDGAVTAKGTTTEENSITLARLIDITGLSGKYTFSVERITGTDVAFSLSLHKNGTYQKTISLTSAKVSITFDATGYDFGYISIVNTETGRAIDAKMRFMLEKGTKASAWSPAPEDFYSEIDLTNATVSTHTETLSTHDARITAAENAITLKVSATDFNSYKTTVTGDINTAKNAAISAAANDATAKSNKALSDAKADATTKANDAKAAAISTAAADAKAKADKALADSKVYTNAQVTTVNESLSVTNQEINIMKGQIALKVEQTDIDKAIINLELGGRNLLLNTLDPVATPSANRIMINGQDASTGLPSGCTIKATEHGYSITVNSDGGAYPYCRFGTLTAASGSLNGLEPGQTYTISMEVRYKLASNLTSNTTMRIYLYDDSETNGTFGVNDSVSLTAEPGKSYDTWRPLSLTFTVPENATMLYINIRPGNTALASYAAGDYIAFRNIKLEKGTKATDWTPAPEDVDASIETVNNKFASYSTTTQMQSAIDLAKNSITSTVAEAYATKSEVSALSDETSAKMSSMTSRLSVAESKLTKDSMVTTIGEYYAVPKYVDGAKASAISTAAADAAAKANSALADAKSYTDNVEIGGRNLLPNTRDMAGYTKASNVTLSEDAEGITTASFAAVSTLAYNSIATREPIPFSAVRGQRVTFSVWVRSDDAAAINADTSHGLLITFGLCTGTSTTRTLYRSKGFYTTELSSSWQKITWTADLSDSFFASGTGTIDYDTRFIVYVYDYSTYRMQVKKLKLELGDKATDWQPSPDDDLAYIASVETIATQTQTMFGWIVKSGTSSTNFTLTDRTATLVANAINLGGLVTFSGLDSTARSKIDTAQSTADTAVTNAAAAQSTANSAGTAASSAQTTANTANARATYNYGTCATAAATAAKVVTCANFPALYAGATAWVKFTYANTAANPTLNVNGTGAKAIYAYGSALTSSSAYNWVAGATVQFVYNGTQWELADSAGLNKVNTAQTTADTAKTNAATAQTTADAAKTAAATAQTTANTANTTLANWCYNNDKTYINGAKIYTGTVTAKQINVSDLFAQNITATGTITGVTLKSAVINSTSGNIGGLTIADGTLSAKVTSGSKEARLTINSKTPSIELLTDDGENLPFATTIDGDGITCWNGIFQTLKVDGGFSFSNYAGNIRRPISSTMTEGQRIANTSSGVSSGTYYVKISGEYGTSGTFVAKQFNATTSDIRLKENIAPATVEALPVLNKIGMYQFDWKQDHTHWDVGFVADYLETIDSKFAIGGGYDEDGNMDEKGVNEFYVMGYVVKGIQELCDWTACVEDKVTCLGTRVASAEADIVSIDAKYQSRTATLEARISSLQYQLQQAFTRIAEQEKLIKQLQAVG